MRNYLVAAMLFCALGHTFAQQIAIPYRDGTKWGTSDRDGKMITMPQFDSLKAFEYREISYRFLEVAAAGKRGILKDGKELLAPVYDNLFFDGDYIRAEKNTGNATSLYLFDTEGNALFSKPMMRIEMHGREWIRDKEGEYRLVILSGTDENGLESIFTWNGRDKAVSQWLAKDVYSVAFERVRGNDYLLLRKREKQVSPVVLERYAYMDGKFYPAPANKPLLSERDRESLANYRSSYGGGEGYGNGSGSGTGEYDGDISIAVPDIYYGDLRSPEVPPLTEEDRQRKEREKAGLVQQYYFFKDTNGKLAATRYIGGKAEKMVSKFQPESFTVKNGQHTITVKDTVYTYSNTLLYKYKGRQGIMAAWGQRKEYDTIIELKALKPDGYTATGFIAGNRDKKTKKMKYGITDANGDAKAMEYDAITPDAYRADLIAVKNGKYGLLDAEGNSIVPVDNDMVTKKGNGEALFFEIKKDGLYGVHLRRRKEKAITLAPVFKYGVKDIFLNYPFKNPYGKEENMVLIQLSAADGSIVGYAREDGFLYFKE